MPTKQTSAQPSVTVVAVITLPPRTPEALPKWVWSYWRELVLAAKKELRLSVITTAEVVDRWPYPEALWRERGYEQVMLAIGLG